MLAGRRAQILAWTPSQQVVHVAEPFHAAPEVPLLDDVRDALGGDPEPLVEAGRGARQLGGPARVLGPPGEEREGDDGQQQDG